jgi:malate dehydrogenase (oxaloacetate-decarboxylating)
MKEAQKKILRAFRKVGGRVETKARVTLKSKADFALFYTPGVGVVSSHLAKYPSDAYALSVKNNSVAVVSDGTAVLGLGDIGPYGALPVMEGKALIFKQLAGINAWPIVLDTKDTEEIIRVVKAIAPNFGGINLEDIAAPKCFEIEQRLIKELTIPVMHDDQHGTAIVVLAGLINAAKVVKKDLKKLRIVITGAGAAGTAVTKLLLSYGVKDIIVIDRTSIIFKDRPHLSFEKQELARNTNPRGVEGGLSEALKDAHIFIGLSGPNVMQKEHVRRMAPSPIIFALSNPVPEIMPEEAQAGGAGVIATGRSDFPNQINNALVFPGVFRGAFDNGVREITQTMKLKAAKALASLVTRPSKANIIPEVTDKRVVKSVAKAIR